MSKKIIITESQLKFLVEQGSTLGLPSSNDDFDASKFFATKYNCIQNKNLAYAVKIAIEDHKIDPLFVRYAAGILGRESDFGKIFGNSIKIGGIPIGSILPTKYAIKALPEYILNSMDDDNPLKKLLIYSAKKITGKSKNWVPSMGVAQMTPDVAKKYGVSITDLMGMTGSLVAAASYLRDIYYSLKNFDENSPSLIIIKNKLVQNPSSTGNARLDAAIMSYNSGAHRFAKNYCKTSDPNYLSPCDKIEYLPYPNDRPDFKLKVNQKDFVKNYTPRIETKTNEGTITSYGYLKEVKERANSFNCIR